MIKIVVIGDAAVGKTSLINRYLRLRNFDPHEPTTIGAQYETVTMERDAEPVEVRIWDTAGQEQYRSICAQFARDASGALVVFDVTNPKSYANLAFWLRWFHDGSNRNKPVVIVGNKMDWSEERGVNAADGAAWAMEHSCQYVETSGLSGEGVGQAFETLIDEVMSPAAERDEESPRGVKLYTESDKRCC